jgi:hypothetical protein
MRRMRGKRIALLGAILALLATGSAWAAFQGLPADNSQVNNDPNAAVGINPADPVNIEDPANADVVGGALDATKPAVPWSIFRQLETAAGKPDQIFSRSFAAGKWTTRGVGTVGGRSSASPTFTGSLNFDQTVDGEAPAIDFAGAGRTVPWATWYEDTSGTGFAATNIFASRFDNSGGANQGKWLFEGQGRGNGGTGPQVPSLNIHTNRNAINPSVAGGATVASNAPVPWVAWEEADGATTTPDQIFVSKAVKPTAAPTCPLDGTNPAKPISATGAVATFCWQQVGIDRLASGAGSLPPSTTDPSLNIDTTRDGVEPDIAFTGTSDTVPWVVWYEQGPTATGPTNQLKDNELVFAAKATTNTAADGQFQWTSVGNNAQGLLDASNARGGTCGTDATSEGNCSLNADPNASAVDPRVAAGTMAAGGTTVPWVVWEEASGGHERIFVSRLVGTGAAARFVIANGGHPLPTLVSGIDATRPDITFSGNTPYVSWHEGTSVVYGHFTTPDSFVIDNGAVGTATPDSVRAPISSGCTANPFNVDGATCQAAAVGTPFFLFTDGGAADAKLFGKAYQTDAPITGGSSAASASAALVAATVNPQGGPVNVQFEYGPTTGYGNTTGLQHLGPANAATSFAGLLSGLPASTAIHYRAVAFTDFGKVVGGDQSLTTAPVTTPPDKTPPHVKLKIAKTTIKKLLKAKVLKVRVTIDEAASVNLSGSAKAKLKKGSKNVTLGHGSTTFLKAGTKTVSIKLTAAARRVLRHARSATVKVTARATDVAGNKSTKKATRNIKRG